MEASEGITLSQLSAGSLRHSRASLLRGRSRAGAYYLFSIAGPQLVVQIKNGALSSVGASGVIFKIAFFTM